MTQERLPIRGRVYTSYEDFCSRFYGVGRENKSAEQDSSASFGKRLAKLLVGREKDREKGTPRN